MSQKSHEPQTPYLFERMEGSADETNKNPLDRKAPMYRDELELDLLEEAIDYNMRLRESLARLSSQEVQNEAVALRMLLADVKVEFEVVYAKVPPIFREQWARVARLLGVML